MRITADTEILVNPVRGAEFDAEATVTIFDELFDELVPGDGPADTVAGEILRAVARLNHCYTHDGYMAFVEEGNETCNMAFRYLADCEEISSEMRKLLDIIDSSHPCADCDAYTPRDRYYVALRSLAAETVELINAEPVLRTMVNTVDMWDCAIPEDKNWRDGEGNESWYDEEDEEEEEWEDEEDEEW